MTETTQRAKYYAQKIAFECGIGIAQKTSPIFIFLMERTIEKLLKEYGYVR